MWFLVLHDLVFWFIWSEVELNIGIQAFNSERGLVSISPACVEENMISAAILTDWLGCYATGSSFWDFKIRLISQVRMSDAFKSATSSWKSATEALQEACQVIFVPCTLTWMADELEETSAFTEFSLSDCKRLDVKSAGCGS